MMTPETFAAWVGGTGTLLITLTRSASWVMKQVAANKVERRIESDATLSAVKAELVDCRKEVDIERTRKQDTERERDIMERILFRLGYEPGGPAGWRKNGDPKT